MAYLLKTLINSVSTYEEYSDPRVKNWPLMDSPWPTIVICGIYIYVVMNLLPKFMKTRQAYNIDKLLIAYNLCQVLANSYLIIKISAVIIGTFNMFCNAVDFSDNPSAMTLLRMEYFYHILKIVDLLDTVFFVLRKKQSQVTFLHVYHHAMLVIFTWLFTKFGGGGQTMILTVANSFVHTCMYTYYMCSVWNKKLRTNHTIKRRITELQLVQFTLGMYFMLAVLFASDCGYSKVMPLIGVPQFLFFTVLFGDFYRRTYLPSSKDKIKKQADIN